MVEQFNLDEYLELCQQENVTVLTGMPPVIHSLTRLETGAEKQLKNCT